MRKYLPVAVATLAIALFALAQSFRVGPVQQGDGNVPTIRYERSGGLAIAPVGSGNRERVGRGVCYYGTDTGAGTAPGTSIGTTAALVLYNPQNSGVRIVIRKVWMAYVSGTLGSGVMYHCVNPTTTQTAPSGGNALTIKPALAGNNDSHVAICLKGATVVAPNPIAAFCGLSPILASSVEPLVPCNDDLEDGVQLLPGTSYQLQAVAAAGTSPLISPSVFWEEAPLLNGQP